MHCSRAILCSLVIFALAIPTASFSQQINPGGQTGEAIQAPPPSPAYQAPPDQAPAQPPSPAYQAPPGQAPSQPPSPAYQAPPGQAPVQSQSPAYQAPPSPAPAEPQAPAYQTAPPAPQTPPPSPTPVPARPETVAPPAEREPAPAPKEQKSSRGGADKTRESRTVASQATTGTIRMALAQGAFLLSASGGQGTLSYRGKKYPFRIGGGGIGAIGFSRADVVGTVENLNRIEDFPGAYLEGRAGYAAGTGVSRMRLENTKGVVLRLRSVTKGLALSLGGEGLLIELLEPARKP